MFEGRTRGIEAVAGVLGGLVVLEWGVVLLLQPRLVRMLADFGSELPWASRVGLSQWSVSALLLVALCVSIDGVVRRGSESAMVARVIALLVIALTIPALFLIGAYLPWWSISSEIR